MRALILGKGVSGRGAARLLRKLGVSFSFYQDGDVFPDLGSFDFAVKSPGIPINHKILRYLREKGTPVLGETELAYRFSQGNIISVTGTNGKSTTTAIIHSALKTNGYKSFIGGNFDIPFSEFALKTDEETISVIELSSFQIEDIISYTSDISIILNITPDHMNRYSCFSEYRRAKLKLIKNSELTILNRDDPELRSVKADQILFFSKKEKADAYIEEGKKILVNTKKGKAEIPLEELPLKGSHNLENYLASALALTAAGLYEEEIIKGLKSFSGLPHRTEKIAEIDRITFINDSKSTNPDSLKKALESFQNIILIAGGSDKGLDFKSLRPLFRERVKFAVFIGETAEILEKTFKDLVPVERAFSMSEAVKKAFHAAEAGDTVLLSPGCASFDMFKNFEERGEAFKREVLKLKRELEEKS